jgi:hypothetical protein
MGQILPFIPPDPITALRRCILVHNYQPISIWNWDAKAPCKTPGKQPFDVGWPVRRGMPAFHVQAQNTGIICNNLRAVDVDIDDGEAARTAVALAEEHIGRTIVRLRDNSPRRLLLYRGSGPKRIITTKAGKVEILGDGQQFAAFGRHHTGAELEWEEYESPACFAYENLPEAMEEAEQRFAAELIEALGGIPVADVLTDLPVAPRPVQATNAGDDRPIFRRVNDAALANLGAWVQSIFPGAKPQAGTGAFRVTSRQLRRDLQEDLSLAPGGIIDFGVADMGDARSGRRTAIDVVMEWGSAADPVDAWKWNSRRRASRFPRTWQAPSKAWFPRPKRVILDQGPKTSPRRPISCRLHLSPASRSRRANGSSATGCLAAS